MHEFGLVLAHRQLLWIFTAFIGPAGKLIVDIERVIVGRGIRAVMLPAPFGEPGVAHDRQQPGARIVALIAIEETKGSQEGFLHDVVGVRRTAAQPAGKVIRRVQMRQHHRVEAIRRVLRHRYSPWQMVLPRNLLNVRHAPTHMTGRRLVRNATIPRYRDTTAQDAGSQLYLPGSLPIYSRL